MIKINCLLVFCLKRVRSSGHRPVIVQRALIGSKDGWKLSTICKLKSVLKRSIIKLRVRNRIYYTGIYLLHFLKQHITAFLD